MALNGEILKQVGGAASGIHQRLSLKGHTIGAADAVEFFEKFTQSKKARIHEIELSNNGIQGVGVPILAEWLKTNSTVRKLQLSDNDIGDEGAIALAECLKVNSALTTVMLSANNITDAGAQALAEAISCNDTLTGLWLTNNAFSPKGTQMLEDAIIGCNRRNLTTIYGFGSERLKDFCEKNRHRAGVLRDKLHDRHLELSPKETLEVLELLPTIRVGLPKEKEVRFWDFVHTLPAIDLETTIKPESLFSADGQGFTPLHNPLVWKNFPAICKKLVEQGTPLTMAHLQEERNDGKTVLQDCLRYVPLDRFIPGLNSNGIRIQTDMLLDGQRQPTPEFRSIIENGDIDGLFTKENWLGAQPAALRATVRAMPEAAQKKLTNLHSLASQLNKPGTSQSR